MLDTFTSACIHSCTSILQFFFLDPSIHPLHPHRFHRVQSKMNKQVLPILNTIKETSSNSRTSSATSSPLSSAPNSPEWPCPDHPPGNSDTSTDSVTSAISYLGLSPESMRADFLTALRQLNDRAGTMLTPAEFQAAVSLIDNRYGVKTCGAALLGLGPDYSLGMGNIGKSQPPTEFSEGKCR